MNVIHKQNLKKILEDLKFEENSQMHLTCHKQLALRITSNIVFHERTTNIVVGRHSFS